MKTIIIDHLKCSQPKKKLFSRTIVQDYEVNGDIIREFSHPNRIPRYKSMKTRKPVKVDII